jgi:hypothetical protein
LLSRIKSAAIAVAITMMGGTPMAAHAEALPSWSDQMEALKEIGDRLLASAGRGDTDARRQEMYRYILGSVADGYLNYVNMDPAHPTWAPLWNHALNYGGANPDYVYMATVVDPKGSYRISGYRGTSRFVEIAQQTNDWVSPRRTDVPGVAVTHDLDSLKCDADGYFSVILSAQRPAGYTGDWWELDPATVTLLMRKASYDWRGEKDPRIAIVRLDDAPPMTPQEIARKFANLKTWATNRIEAEIKLAAYYREAHGVNVITRSKMWDKDKPVSGQVYMDGAYEFADDEALLVQVKLPQTCRYWQILLTDDKFTTVDWVNRQSSLNGHQARIDKDGWFRAVVAARDPGVPNWLDTAGNAWGVMQMRWNQCSDAPEPEVVKVKLADVRKRLPADTPVVTPEQRKEQLRARSEAAQLRQIW